MPNLRAVSGAIFWVVLLCAYLSGQSSKIGSSVHLGPSALKETMAQEQIGGAEDVDSQPARAFRTTVRNLFNDQKFEQLEEIAGAARSQKERYRGGAWKLRIFYKTIQEPGSLTATDAAWDAHIDRLRRWIAAKPNSPTPRVALAQSYLQLAWKARGNGYANTVTSDDWKLFNQRVQQAQETLQQAESLGVAKDPEWYRNMQTVARAQGWDRARAEDLVQKASNFEPGYYYFYNAHANYLLPKWYGKAGESETFAQTISDQVGGREGDFVYFMLVLDLNCCKPKAQMQNISWDRVKQGFAALEELYGSTNYEVNGLAYTAVRQGDRQFAQQLFTRIGDDWDEDVWHTKENFTRSKSTLSLDRKENQSSLTRAVNSLPRR